MRTILDSTTAPARAAFVDRKSEFIGHAAHIDTLDEAIAFVQTIRQQHPKARHVAYAAVVGGSHAHASERMSDDGEPSGTAGKPMLDVLRVNDLTDCVVTVTRYFGGILLGSGGLIRAYATGASMAVKSAQQADILQCRQYRVTLDYSQLARLQQLLAAVEGVPSNESYTANITLIATVPVSNAGRFEERVREAFNAAIVPEPLGVVHRAVAC